MKFISTDKMKNNSNNFKKIAETTENKHFKPNLETHIKCDASRKSLRAALEQRTPEKIRNNLHKFESFPIFCLYRLLIPNFYLNCPVLHNLNPG